jgi:hypothetical protein
MCDSLATSFRLATTRLTIIKAVAYTALSNLYDMLLSYKLEGAPEEEPREQNSGSTLPSPAQLLQPQGLAK